MVLLAIAKERKLDVALVETNPDYPLSAEYLKLNPQGRVPTFQAPDGWVLTEVIAISLYCKVSSRYASYHSMNRACLPLLQRGMALADSVVAKQNGETALLGQNDRDYAQIIRWMSFFNSEIQPSLAKWYKPMSGRWPYDEQKVREAAETANKAIAILEAHFTENTYFLGDRLTLADLLAVSCLSRGYQYVFGKEWRETFPNVTRWFLNMTDQPVWKEVASRPAFIDEPVHRE